MTQKSLPVFEGKPLVILPKEIPSANFLEGDFGKAFLDEYNGRVKRDYDNASALNVLSYDNDVVRGSNPFAVTLTNQILAQEGYRVARQADLEKVLATKAFDLRGTYEDSALVLRTRAEPNEYLANNIAEQLDKRGVKSKHAIVIPLTDLTLVKDENSPHKLAFNISDGYQPIEAPVLSNKYNQKSFSETDDNGLPIKDKLGNGNRTLYTRDSGLSRLYLYGNLNLGSYYEDLASSNEYGRVVVVSGGAAAAEFLAQYTSRLQEQLVSRKNELDKWYIDSLVKIPKF